MIIIFAAVLLVFGLALWGNARLDSYVQNLKCVECGYWHDDGNCEVTV